MTQILKIQLKSFLTAIAVSFLLLIALTIGFLVIDANRSVSLSQTQHSIAVNREIVKLEDFLQAASITSRKLELYKDEAARVNVAPSRAAFFDKIQDVRDLVSDNPKMMSVCDGIRAEARRYFAAQDEIIKISDTKGTEAAAVAIRDLHSLDLFESVSGGIAILQTEEFRLYDERRDTAVFYRNLFTYLTFAVLAFLYAGLGIVLFSGLQVKRTIEENV